MQKAQALSSTLISTNRSCSVEKTLYDQYSPFVRTVAYEVLNLDPDLLKGVGYGPFRDNDWSPSSNVFFWILDGRF